MLATRNRCSSLRGMLMLSSFSALLAACAGQGDVTRVQTDAIDKSIFFEADGVTPRTFYYRQTITGVPPTSAFAFEGQMTPMEKIRFEIGEFFLTGFRSYDYAPGSESPTTSGTNNDDTPVVRYAITSHFDIKREYNPGTGEETNVISENDKDRPWNERQYMRIDYSQNQVDPAQLAAAGQTPFLLAASASTGIAVTQGDDPLFNPDRPIFSRDYIDFTFKQTIIPDLYACYTMFGGDDEVGPFGCGNADITFRNSFMPVPNSEYEPLSYPDRQVVKNTDGTPLRMAFTPNSIIPCTPKALQDAGLTGDDCTDASLDEFAKFGFFRTALPTYDRQVGSTQQAREYFINRWNIWQETIQKGADGKTPLVDAKGNPIRIPISQRKTRTIAYYLNPEFPDDQPLKDMAHKVIDDWNQAMKQTVAGLRLTSSGQPASIPDLQALAQTLPDIFVLKDNDCTLANVNAFVTANPDVRQMVEARDTGNTLDFDNLQQADLLRACTALTVVTQSRSAGDKNHPKFDWERDGDLRYSFIHWVDRPQVQGPLGYGPSSPDPQTGEIVSAAAYLYGAALDIYAKFAVDSVQAANGNLSIDDLLSGRSISDVLAESAATTATRKTEKMTDAARSMIQARFAALGATPDARIKKVAAGIDDQPMNLIKGTTAEKLLLNDDILPAVINGYRPGDAVPNNVWDLAMATPWLSSQTREQRRQRFQTLAQSGCVYMAEFADDAILGTALELDKMHLTPDEMFKELRTRIFRGLTDHEVGHTMGLRHNFAASTDALNYDDQYWTIRAQYPQETWESDHKLSEFAYASVMDYGARFNSDIQGLGKYDTAAIRFGYGQLFDMIPASTESALTGLRNDITLNDYTHLTDAYETGGIENFNTSATFVLPYQQFIDLWTSEFRQLDQNMGLVSVLPERPYKFCEDMFEGNLDCKTWDRGANQQEIVDNVTEQYRNYYAFNAYRRGRSNWGIDGYLNRLQERYFNRYSEAFQFFFFLSSYTGYDLGVDLFLASVDALNAIGAILQTPEPGLHCPTATSPNIATFPTDEYGNIDASLCLPGKPKMQMDLPDAKPFYINFSDDYYYTFTRVGSLLEKLQALASLTSTESRFFRVDELSDVAARSSINYYRIFRDEVVKLLSGIIRNDHAAYAATISGTAPNFTYQPTPVVDLDTFGLLNPPTPAYAQPGAVRVLTPVNKSVRYWALLYGLGRLGSTWDYTLDFQNFLAVGVKGADDDFTIAPNLVAEYTHPETGIVYRAPTNTGGAAPNIGKQILDELTAITGVPGTRGTVPLTLGSYSDGTAVPDWYSAKADLDAAAAGTDQAKYTAALSTFNYVNSLIGYDVDLIADIRMFRKELLLP